MIECIKKISSVRKHMPDSSYEFESLSQHSKMNSKDTVSYFEHDYCNKFTKLNFIKQYIDFRKSANHKL